MANSSLTPMEQIYDELSTDIFAYAESKLPDADKDALTDIICYVLQKVPYLIEQTLNHKPKTYMDILVEMAGSYLEKGEQND